MTIYMYIQLNMYMKEKKKNFLKNENFTVHIFLFYKSY